MRKLRGMSGNLNFLPAAVAKTYLHAAKYPNHPLNGVLLASETEDGLLVKDAIPFFHSQLELTPMLEIALCQIDAYCKANDLQIAGYYEVEDTPGNLKKPGFRANCITERISEHYPGTFVMFPDVRALFEPTEFKNMVYVYTCPPGDKWKSAKSYGLLDLDLADFVSGLRVLMQDGVHKTLTDFDDHLDDISLDWKNRNLNERLKATFAA
ncbi:unnamed protein product [Notodromas monacha]|uniref:MPN domain-containing protein n=1 Tax=Notodromas monacha TaxID=399045 RepID=A0A7R9GCY7_9CRUS|nr:unnamed protein product [Notodromas monacha]CAG0916591.1 unnamed protein product [Notodromas monacha]